MIELDVTLAANAFPSAQDLGRGGALCMDRGRFHQSFRRASPRRLGVLDSARRGGGLPGRFGSRSPFKPSLFSRWLSLGDKCRLLGVLLSKCPVECVSVLSFPLLETALFLLAMRFACRLLHRFLALPHQDQSPPFRSLLAKF